MTKHEFENLIGHEISPEQYSRVIFVYCQIDSIDEQAIADIYKLDSSFVTDILYNRILGFESPHAGTVQ